MANRKQRMKNRATAKAVDRAARVKRNSTHVCENCGGFGGHWICTRGTSVMGMLTGVDDQEGFWTCDKYYGEDGRRLPEKAEKAETTQ